MLDAGANRLLLQRTQCVETPVAANHSENLIERD